MLYINWARSIGLLDILSSMSPGPSIARLVSTGLCTCLGRLAYTKPCEKCGFKTCDGIFEQLGRAFYLIFIEGGEIGLGSAAADIGEVLQSGKCRFRNEIIPVRGQFVDLFKDRV